MSSVFPTVRTGSCVVCMILKLQSLLHGKLPIISFLGYLFRHRKYFIHSFIHSFIHIEHLYSASSRELLRGAPDSSTAKKSRIWNYSLKCRGLNEHFRPVLLKLSFFCLPQTYHQIFAYRKTP